ncbi:MAG: (R)-2-hydroxyisocaproyl-CoA dehydratase alpha subunit [Chloroflexi bacterium]|nr:(R)-2-hydroxyisocaproyl-CoA dehydratase alpha subunit [Chloroflexota bacterium]
MKKSSEVWVKREYPRKEIAAARTLKRVMADHYYELDEAAKMGFPKIAWCTSVGPAELLRGMGFLVYYPENHGAMLGASRMATELIPYANAIGYSPEICSYLTSDIGSYLRKKTPLTNAYKIESVPRPDVLVFNTNQCRDVQDWFGWYSRELKVPLIGIHTHRGIADIHDYQIKDIAKQIEGLVPKLEEVSGEKLDMDRLREAVEYSRCTSALWRDCLESASAIPSPWTFFDAVIHMGPAVVARGTRQGVEYYELLLAELRERVEKGVAAVEGERHRLYWEGMPIWGKLRALSEQFSSLKACVVASTYCNSWIFDQLDPNDPFESMAEAYTELFIVRDETYKEQYVESCHKRFKFDGIIFHNARTCPNNSNSRYGMPERLRQRPGIASLVIDGDLNDLRCYSEEQTMTKLEAFIEQLEGEG